MEITKRQSKVLNTIVREYIELAQPVSSQFLEKKYNFKICPATIRIEMQRLTDRGFLYQPHTSAGRIPTDKGYRFFVNDLLEKGTSEFKDIFEIKEIIKREDDIFELISHLSKFLAEISSNLAVTHLQGKDFFWKEGWEEILKEPEFEEKDFVFEFTDFLKNFEENIENLNINSGIKIFIGRENPFSKIKDFSIISSKCFLPNREEAILALLGPKRMTYEKNISLINYLTKLMERL
jgi:transcriptional regulator of heat shock response